MNARPNILCFVTDQLRADHLGCYGNPDARTPHIDRLAAEGVLFSAHYVTNPLCSPSRATWFTGQYPQVHGVRENGIPLPQGPDVLPEVLRRGGYRTAAFGKLHLQPYGHGLTAPLAADEAFESNAWWEAHDDVPRPFFGFEDLYLTTGHASYIGGHYLRDVPAEVRRLAAWEHAAAPPSGAKESWKSALPLPAHHAVRIADQAVAWLGAHDPAAPFFAWCSFPEPHHPYTVPAPYSELFDPARLRFAPRRRRDELADLPDYYQGAHDGRVTVAGLAGGAQISDAHYREILAHTYGMISLVDDQIGRVIAALHENGLFENTLILFMSDHGDLMGDHWLINKGPFLYRGLTRVPLICRLPGGANAGTRRDAFVSTVDFYQTILDFAGLPAPPGRQGRSFRAPLLEGDAPRFRDGIYIEYDSTYLDERLRHWRDGRWAFTWHARRRRGVLFDLARDPHELHNVWDDPAYAAARAPLLQTLLSAALEAESWLPARKGHA